MSSVMESTGKYILGLDLGSASIGWAVIQRDTNGDPCALLAAGSHIFDPGVEVPPAAGKLTQDEAIFRGMDASKAVGRRIARQQRRQIDRRAFRTKKLFKLLQTNSLLPAYADMKIDDLADERCKTFARLDKDLSDALCSTKRSTGDNGVMLEADQALPYVLRHQALERKLELHELGRALYHLCQRRGYRPSQVEETEDEGSTQTEKQTQRKGKKSDGKLGDDAKVDTSPKTVEAGISLLQQKMNAAHAPTLGAYFANFKNNDPHTERIRKRWTSRTMYIDEFKLIWDKQREFYPDLLTDDLRKSIYDCLFFQRPLASSDHLIGRCELEPGERRASWSTLEAQRFRLLQKVNDLAFIPGGADREQKLSREQQIALAAALEMKGDLTFAEIRKELRVPPNTEFNLQRGKKTRIEGNRVNRVMLQVFGDRWNTFAEQEKTAAVDMWAKASDLADRISDAMSHWNLDHASAQIWADQKPPKDYCKLSRKALRRLLEKMEQGMPYKTAELELYGNPLAGKEPEPFVPPVLKTLPSINNPPVVRALTELRKVVNAVIRAYGEKPYEIRIELARELRKNRKQRHDATEASEKNHARRIEAAKKILKECKNYNSPTNDPERLVRERRDDVTKMLLLMECKCLCPYTGDSIPYHALFGGEVEVEHIIPQSLMVDNDFGNLTLCYRSVNAEKLNNTPWKAFGEANEDRWAQIIERVKKFDNNAKLARFQLRSIEEIQRFSNRRLNDTRYTSKLAGRLLMTLYGGRDIQAPTSQEELDEFRDRAGRRAITVSSGMVTSLLRDAWLLNLNGLIGDDAFKCPAKSIDTDEESKTKKRTDGPKRKDRCDHRHHAVDAVVIALTSEKVIREINTLASRLYSQLNRPLNYRDLKSLQQPWPNFIDDNFRNVFRKMIISRRPEHKLSGALHDATFYGKCRGYDKKGDPIRHQRIAINKDLKEAKIEKIVDEGIKKAVIQFGRDIGGFSKWSAEKHGWPTLQNKKTKIPIAIKKVRVKITKNAKTLGKGRSERYVEEGEIAYASFFSVPDKKTRWESDIVTLFDATQRVRALRKADRGYEKVSRIHPDFPDAFFRFSLMKGDLVELLHDGKAGVFVVRSFESDGRIQVAPINAAGKHADLKQTGRLLRLGFTEFLKMGAFDDKVPRPVFVDLLGYPHYVKVHA